MTVLSDSDRAGSRSRGAARLEFWTRRLHIYVGLYFLLFIWLFSFSGLMLNHPLWEGTQYWPQREETSTLASVQRPAASEDIAKATALMQQLHVEGELEQVTNATDGSFSFRTVRPGRIVDVKVDSAFTSAQVNRIALNGWGVVSMLHTFTGVRRNQPSLARDWLLTSVWSLSMDALCVGLIFLVLTALYMWLRLPEKRVPGLLLLGVGSVLCAVFVSGLGLLL